MSLLKNVSGSLAYQIVLTILQFCIVVLFTRWLGAEGRGQLAIFNGAAEIAAVIGGLGISSSIVYFISSKKVVTRSVISAIVRVLAVVFVALLAVTAACYFLNLQFLITPFSSVYVALLFFILVTICTILLQYFTAICNAHNEFILPLKLRCLHSIGLIAALLILYNSKTLQQYPIADKFFYYIVALVLLYIFILSLLVYVTVQKFGNQNSPSQASMGVIKMLLPYGILAFVCNVVQLINIRLDLWFVQEWCDAQQLGIYSIAVLCLQMLWIMPAQIAAIFFTKWSTEMNEDQKIMQVAQTTGILLIGTSIVFLLAWGIGYFLIPFVFGNIFTASVPLLGWLLLGGIPLAATMLISAYNASKNQLKINLNSSLIGLLISIMLYIFLIKKMGVQGAAIASSSSYLATSLFLVFHFKRQHHLHWKDFFSIRNNKFWHKFFPY